MTPSALRDPVIDGVALRAALTRCALDRDTDDAGARSGMIDCLKKANTAGREAIKARLYAGAGGTATMAAYAELADGIVTALYDFTTVHVIRSRNPTEGERLSVCAQGGYGRGLMAPFSDIDVLFLRAWKETPWSESVIEYMLYALWDLGWKVGHAARTIDQAVKIAKEDWTVLTSLMDLRRLSGDVEHPVVLAERLAAEVFKGRARDFVAAKLAERDARLEKAGASRYLVEPDVKEGKGGLRDLHTLDWLARGVAIARGGSSATAQLFRRDDARRFEAAADFLHRVRAFLHLTAGRGQDKLTFDLQPEIARALGFVDAGGRPDVEGFMRQYFLVAKETGALTRILCAKLESEEAKSASRGIMRLLPGSGRKKAAKDEPGLALDSGRVTFDDLASVEMEPTIMLRLMRAAVVRRCDAHPDALQAVARAIDRIDERVRRDPVAVEAFFDILLNTEAGATGLRLMNEAGVLGAFIPEFGQIVARTQFNMYHSYTVDEHSLAVIAGLAALERGRMVDDAAFVGPLFDKLVNRRALYLAGLLHDTGKGVGDQQIEGAKSALAAAERLGLPEDEARLVSWLVGHHLYMNDVAQRRDLGDPRTIADFVAEIGSPERLRLLTLLTIADINAVGPGVWTAWKRRLLEQLYGLAETVFHGGRAHADQIKAAIAAGAQDARAALFAAIADETRADAQSFAAGMEDAYWLSFDTAAHERHALFILSASARGEATAVDAAWLGAAGAAELLVRAPDAPGLFAKVAGAIAGAGGDIRNARAYRASDGAAFEVFLVEPTDGFDDGATAWSGLARITDAVRSALDGGSPPAQARRALRRAAAFDVEPSVAFDNTASADATLIEVSGRDRPGLLAALAGALAQSGLNVASAHIENYGERAMDVFYVTETDGRKVANAARIGAIRRRLMAALNEGTATPPSVGSRRLATARASEAR